MKKAVLSFVLVLALVAIGFVFLSDKEDFSENDQLVLQKTLDISKSYTVLRLKTDDILMNARNYSSHEEWQAEMNIILLEWSDMEKEALALENLAGDMFDENISFKIINSALAYDRQEISDIFDRAPAGKKIATLAKHLGVDAKRAFAILTQDQAQVQADAWNEAGDTFKKLETTAVAIKNTSKVVVFVGTIVVSGGTTAVAAGSTLSKAAVVVAGADLTLEVTDDAAKIALGDKNKISSVAGNARKITEPAAAILMISTLPKNITKAVDKLGVATFGSEQLNSSVQEGKVIGISLPTAVKSSPTKAQTMTVSVLENTELEEWLNDEEATETKETIEEIKTALEKELKNDEAKNNEVNNEGSNNNEVNNNESSNNDENNKEENNNNEEESESVGFENEDELMLEEYGGADYPGNQNTAGSEMKKNGNEKLVQIDFKNAANVIWVLDRTNFGSDEYRSDLDAIDAEDFAVMPGASFASVNRTADDMLRSGSTAFVETSNNTYEYRIQLIAGGTMPEDERDSYVHHPFIAVVDFVVKSTYGKSVTVVWDGSSFRQLD